MRLKSGPLAAALLLSLAGAAVAAENATLLKDDVLRGKPFLDAPSLAPLKRGVGVSVLKRQGSWSQVKSGSRSGWVRSLSLKSGAAALKAGTLASGNTGRLGTGRIVSTTGIRGLNQGEEEQLAKAEFKAEALAAAEAGAVSADEARSFAKKGKLKARNVAWLGKGKS